MVYLASNSPRRRELIKEITSNYQTEIPEADEVSEKEGFSPEDIAVYNAALKAQDVYGKKGGCVIGADTVVVFGKSILGKPKDNADAVATLNKLKGSTHKVITGVCVISKKGEFKGYCTSYVTINDLSDEFIQEYVGSGLAADKAGSYGIQDNGLVKGLKGDRDNVVGFPVKLVKKLLKQAGCLA